MVKKLFVVFLTSLFFFTGIHFDKISAASFSLNVSYQLAECGSPSTFTLSVSGNKGDNILYYFNSAYAYVNGTAEYIFDPSYTCGYQDSNVYQFTFTASGNYVLMFYAMDKTETPYSTVRKIVYITIDDPNYPTVEETANQIVADCLKAVGENASDFDKALWLHDWLINNGEYDNVLTSILYSSHEIQKNEYVFCGTEGMMIRKTGTCESYQRGYSLLLSTIGIENVRDVGNYHTWNIVKLDGKWYTIDPTWDDPDTIYIDDEKYLFFGLNDEITTLVHDEHVVNENAVCDSLDENYFIYTGKIKTYSDPYLQIAKTQIANKTTEFKISRQYKGLMTYYSYIMDRLIAYQLQKETYQLDGYDLSVSVSYDGTDIIYNVAYSEKTQASADIYTEADFLKDTATILKKNAEVNYLLVSLSKYSTAVSLQEKVNPNLQENQQCTLTYSSEGGLATDKLLQITYADGQKSYTIVALGDVNGDGKISASDYVLIKNDIMEVKSIETPGCRYAADVNQDEKISATDYVQIKNYIMA